MADSIEVRPATCNDLAALERLKVETFSSQRHSAMGQTSLEVQTRVRLALDEAIGSAPGRNMVALDESRLVGVVSFATAADPAARSLSRPLYPRIPRVAVYINQFPGVAHHIV